MFPGHGLPAGFYSEKLPWSLAADAYMSSFDLTVTEGQIDCQTSGSGPDHKPLVTSGLDEPWSLF